MDPPPSKAGILSQTRHCIAKKPASGLFAIVDHITTEHGTFGIFEGDSLVRMFVGMLEVNLVITDRDGGTDGGNSLLIPH